MTASSFCQVPLIGSFSNATATTMSSRPVAPRSRVNKVCKNLFGSPEPGEIQQKLYRETEKELIKIEQRYDIDIRKIEEFDFPLPNLIQREQEAYEQTLKIQEAHEQELKIQEANTNSNSGANKKQSFKLIESKSDSQKSREKPYDRQTSITELYSKRKSIPSSVICRQVPSKPTSGVPSSTTSSQ